MSESTPTYPSQGEYIARDSLRELLPNGYTPKGARLLFVHAHPDDESSSTGAAMAYYASAGAEVYLLTATRGEMGEVIPEELQHLEVGKPGNADNGEALGAYREKELAAACKVLGVHQQFFLGQEPAVAPGALSVYRDSGMAWGPAGTPVPNERAAADSLTAQPLEPQAAAVAAAIEAIRPDVVITYDADGGYGHPDHRRVHEIVMRAVQLVQGTPAEPLLVWGLDSSAEPEKDMRTQAAVYGDGTAKREAMRAHATQLVITGPKTFEYSNKVPQKISAVETYRVLAGDARRLVPSAPEPAGWMSTSLVGVILGVLSGVAGSLYHAWVVYAGDTPIPVGLALAVLTVLSASLWTALSHHRPFGALVTGGIAAVTVHWLAYGRADSPFVLVNPDVYIGQVGTWWYFLAPISALVAYLWARRRVGKDAEFYGPRAMHERARQGRK